MERPTVALASGTRIPVLGLGVWQMASDVETEQAAGGTAKVPG